MQKKILTADGGSTKTTWKISSYGVSSSFATTRGLNPFLMSEVEITMSVRKELLGKESFVEVDEINFFGAGCSGEGFLRMKKALAEIWPMASKITVGSDIVGAASALFGMKGNGIACILGTGSNSCLYLDGEMVENISPLGYILGDEGSGAVLGRRLAGDVLKQQMPSQLCKNFFEEYDVTADVILERVYRQPMPSRYLASFVPFIVKHRRDFVELRKMVMEEFGRFFKRNICLYKRSDLSVGFVGGVAFSLREELYETASAFGYKIGRILREPLVQND